MILLFPVDKENVIRNICEQMKVKLVAEEQLLLLVLLCGVRLFELGRV